MLRSQTHPHSAKPKPAMDELMAFIDERRNAKGPVTSLEEFERETRRRFAAAEAQLIGEELGRFDLDVPVVVINGMSHRQVLRCEQTYMTAAGPVSVERSLYSTRGEEERAVAVMELQAGVVEQYRSVIAEHTGLPAHGGRSSKRSPQGRQPC